MSVSIIRIGLLIGMVAAVTHPAAAQSQPPGLSIAAGAGIALPFHSDFSFDAFAWQASMRVRAADHLLIEGMLDQWRHTTTSRRRDIQIFNPSGVIGHIDEVTAESLDTMTVVGMSLLGTGSIGRVRISAGGGPGYMVEYERNRTTLSGCSAIVPYVCEGRTKMDSFLVFSIQALADVDVALTRNVSAVGRFMTAVPFRDPAYGHVNATAGLRLSFQ